MMKKNDNVYLVHDSGGRGIAIMEALERSGAGKVIGSPANGGVTWLNDNRFYNLEVADELGKPGDKRYETAADYYNALLDYAEVNDVTHIIVGPEAPLTHGIVDMAEERNFDRKRDPGKKAIRIIGPNKIMAQMESSKAYCNDVCAAGDARIPEYEVFTDPVKAMKYVEKVPWQVVVKADGLCGGKGAHPCNDDNQAMYWINALMRQDPRPDAKPGALYHSDAGKKVVIERRMFGVEGSWFGYKAGEKLVSLGLTFDYPFPYNHGHPNIDRFFNGMNPVGGGFGSEMPHPLWSDELEQSIVETVVRPQLKSFKEKEGMEWEGFFYSGLMFENIRGMWIPMQCEGNIRLGDPEAQALLANITNFCDVLDGADPEYRNVHVAAPCVVAGPLKGKKGWFQGYPGRSHPGEEIFGLDHIPDDITVIANGFWYHPDEKAFDGSKGVYKHQGGRVLTAVATGETRAEAVSKALSVRQHVWFPSFMINPEFGYAYDDTDLERIVRNFGR